MQAPLVRRFSFGVTANRLRAVLFECVSSAVRRVDCLVVLVFVGCGLVRD